MVVKLILLYPLPANVPAFDATYATEQLPRLLAALTDLDRCVVSKAIWRLDGDLPFHIMVEFYFPSLESLQAATQTDTLRALIDLAIAETAGRAPISVVCMEEVVVLDARTASI